MYKTRNLILAGLLCFVGNLASANSVNTIPINGTAAYGSFPDLTAGTFSIQGPGLSLSQALPVGPVLFIGYCYQGGVCNFGFKPDNAFDICGFCTGYSSGSLGSKTAGYLDQNLRFSGGSAFYPIDGYTLLMHFTVAGTVTGYELVNCSGGIGCSLGPKEFTVQIFGQGTEELYLDPYNFAAAVTGVDAAFSGTATVVPEPTSLLLTGTGLVWVWTKKNMRRANNSKS